MQYHVEDYGAVGDGKTNDTLALQAALDACGAAGGGQVVLESGRTYYAGSLTLHAHVEMHLARGSVLRAHAELAAYLQPNAGAGAGDAPQSGNPVTQKPSYAFLYAKDADYIAISGDGVIDGNACAFVHRVSRYYVTGDFYPRPTLLYFEHCNHLSVTGVTLQNAPFWTLHPAGCDDVLISGIRILNDLDVANSDGIDPDHCTNVRILGCHITCADDCICLKTTAGNMEYGPTRGVIIADCTLVSTSAALKIGTEGVGDFENILVSNCVISGSNRGISIQIRDKGSVRNASFSGITIETRRFADDWWGCAEPIVLTTLCREEGVASGGISGVRFSNITCDSENGVLLVGHEGCPIRDVLFDGVQVTLRKKSKWRRGRYDLRPGVGQGIEETPSAGFFLRRAEDIVLRNCRVQLAGEDVSDFGAPLVTERCARVLMENACTARCAENSGSTSL